LQGASGLLGELGVERLQSGQELPVEVARIRSLRRGRPFQNHTLMSATIDWRSTTRTVKKGSYLVRTGQPLGQLIVTLLEAESSDGLLTWNFFDHCIAKGQDFPVWKLMHEVSLPASRVSRVRGKRQLNLDQIYGPRRVNFWGQFGRSRWVSANEYSQNVAGQTVAVEAGTGARKGYQRTGPNLAAFLHIPGFSNDEAQSILRARRKSSAETKARRLTHSAAKEQYSSFSPDGRLIAFIRNFNLYVLSVENGKEWALTTKGHGKLLHGQLDWVYQEELYGRGRFKAYWWSPKSTHIAFLRLDESPVKDYTVTDHIPVRGRLEVTSYPKAGDPLPRVSLGVVKAAGGATKWIETPKARGLERLIGKVSWSPGGEQVIYQILNRLQNHLDLRAADPRSARSWSLIEEKSKAWVEIHGDPIWLKNGDFLWQSDRSGHRHLYYYNRGQKKLKALTKGPWNVRRVHGLDLREQWIYFSGTKDSAIESHGYRVLINGQKLKRLTKLGESHSLQFNSSKTHFIASSSSAHRPPHQSLFKNSGAFVRSLEPNYENVLDAYAISKPEFMKVPTKDGTLLNGMLIKPPHFNPKKKYPVLCYVYSGPGAPSVWNRWGGSRTLWHQMLAQEGYCVWVCDNRSANPTGIKNTWPIYRDMGSKELADIEDGLNFLGKKGFVDMKRIGIWGWSYGGYMTSYALTHSKMFKMGIAGAPVTDWRNYDAIYTERYMGLPQDNAEGYRSSSVVKAAGKLSGSLLLIHGSIDDNVHLSNTLQLAEALQKAGKHFEMMVYPRNRHGISRPGQSRHLRELMTRFIRKNL
ncbi:MAG: DPP IV N-terminal domain-containing protein, partial [Planctomycetota bacterium]|nr:DPP IV N-terminal domain-containing protein [Planctomycetota bacterium]